ncbi:LLM class F420-dependent oxidoreductase [Pseudonocardia sp. NPDC049154]|uniref:LLM class F420-dependent oxidoreductase n=1 Tax=Pseudonocardia sp. NPDC049154 TaxID=3155501 RepID=UPI0033D8E6F8
MQVGVLFYLTGYTIDPVTLGRAVEAAGFDSIWLPDHPALPVRTDLPFPMTGGDFPRLYGEMADPFVTMGFLAAATTTLKVATGVCVVPGRHPLNLAKAASTVDNFSNGRLLLGIGVGYLREEIALFGVDFATRWSYARETIDFCRRLWKDGQAGYDGKILHYPEVIIDPLPAQRPGPPVIIGGLNTAYTYRRVAHWGDGWLATLPSPEQIAEGRKAITAECEAIGRDPAEIEISVLTHEADPALREAYAEAGADRLVVMLYNHPGRAVTPDEWLAVSATAATSPAPTPEQTLDALDRIRSRAGL